MPEFHFGEIPPQKPPLTGIFLHADCPLFDLAIMSYGLFVGDKKTILLFPNGIMKARVLIPDELRESLTLQAHARSTFARLGMYVVFDQKKYAQRILESHPIPPKLTVTVINWGEAPMLLREGDSIAISNASIISAEEGTPPYAAPRTITYQSHTELHAGKEYIALNKEKLPRFFFGKEKSLPYVDPRNPHVSEYFETKIIPQKGLWVSPDGFLVVLTREQLEIPSNHIGMVHHAIDAIPHSSANLVYPDWRGHLALEFKAIRRIVITEGLHIAWISTHHAQNPLVPYRGRYQNQQSAKPHG